MKLSIKQNIKQFLFVLAMGSLMSLGIFGQSNIPESPIKTVYITPFSHYDFGFVEPPEAIRARAARHIDEVIRVAEENPNFRWTIESVWQVNEWLKRQKKPTSVLPKDKEKIARLIKLINSGQVALSMSWGSMHTDFMGAEELNRLAYDYAALKRTYNISSEFATLNDVPGHPTTMPSVLSGSGAKYMVTGANLFIGPATSLAPGKVPFYWESPDGSKVLTWISQGTHGGYLEGMTDFFVDPFSHDPYTDITPFDMFNPELAGKLTPEQIQDRGITELLNRYNKAGYKYDAVMVMYGHDFVEPTNVVNLEKAVKMWNDRHSSIKLKIATMPEFLKYIEGKYKKDLPTYRGEWSGLWSEAKTQSPKISALARYAHNHTPAAESLWSAIAMSRSIPVPTGNFAALYDLGLTYDEHSGAGNNGWPQLNSRSNLEEQNRQYVHYMQKAENEIDTLFAQGIRTAVQPTRFDKVTADPAESKIYRSVVYNGLSWQRDDVVTLAAPEKDNKITAIRDLSDNRSISFDIDEKGNALFVARSVPAFGYKVYEITAENGTAVSTFQSSAGNTAANENFSVELNADGTIKSIRDKKQNREIVNSKGELPFNDLLLNEGPDASRIIYPLEATLSVQKGKHITRLVIERRRSVFPITYVTIYDGLDRVDLRNELDPTKMTFTGGNNNWHDSYYFAFTFNVSADGLKVIRGGQKWFDMLPEDYLPDARRDSVSTQHMLGMTDGRSTAMLAHRQAFHWVFPSYISTKVRAKDAPAEFPAMFMGKFPLPEATIYSRALRYGNQADTNDLGIVNIATVEPGLTGNQIYEYSLSAGGTFDAVAGWRHGAGFNLPLRAKYVSAIADNAAKSYFAIDAANVQIVTIKAASDSTVHGAVSATPLNPKVNKEYIIRLQEFAGRPALTRITLPVNIKAASLVSLTEDRTLGEIKQISPLTVNLRPYETATVKIVIE